MNKKKNLKKLKKWLTKLPTCDKVDKSSTKTNNFIEKVFEKNLKKFLTNENERDKLNELSKESET